MEQKKRKENLERRAARWEQWQVYCALCQGELYPGDRYFLLEGLRVCDSCLEGYARRYFAPQRRRVERGRGHESA